MLFFELSVAVLRRTSDGFGKEQPKKAGCFVQPQSGSSMHKEDAPNEGAADGSDAAQHCQYRVVFPYG